MPVAIGIGLVAIAGATAYGAYASSKQAKEAQKSANAASAERDKYYSEMTDLAKKQYERWEQDFGEIQTEVADYYKNLTDDILKQQYEDANTEANQSLVKSYFQAQKNLSSSMNKIGMTGSGADVSSSLQLQQSMLQQKASNRWQTEQLKANANNVLMGQKQQWTAQGENLRSQAMQNQFNAEQIKGNDAAARYLQYQNQAYQAEQNMINTITSGVASMGGMMIGTGAQMYGANLDRQTALDIAQMKYGTNSTSSSYNFTPIDYTGNSMLNIGNAATRSHLTSNDWISDTLSGYTRDTFKNSNTKTTSLYFGSK